MITSENINKMKTILTSTRVIPVMVIDHLDDAIPIAKALIDGGLNVLEITLRTPVALDAIKQIKKAFPSAIIGSGTVVDEKTLEQSMNANVDFLVSPGTHAKLIDCAKANDAPLLAGVSTASEVMNLQSHGFHCMKFFPAAAAGGPSMLKSIGGPLPDVTFCPTGGISLETAPNYLALSNVACVGGSWMLNKELVKNKNWNEITALAKQASEL